MTKDALGLIVFAVFLAVATLLILTIINRTQSTDIWMLQKLLMHKSGQALPPLPELNRTTLLYYALLLEEMEEKRVTLVRIMSRLNQFEMRKADDALLLLNDLHLIHPGFSASLRQALAKLPEDWKIELSRSEAIALLDDNMDVTVVAAGFGLASGLPCAAGYEEVLESNLSKVNPVTGMIDKDESGKWIKGKNYRHPELGPIIDAVWQLNHRHD